MKSFKAMVRVGAAGSAVRMLALGLLCACLPRRQAAGEIKVKVTRNHSQARQSYRCWPQPASLVVTAADLARGYVDVPAASQVAIQSNTSGGYMLEFASQGDFMRQILVHGLAPSSS